MDINRDSNSYTFIYASALVVVVAAVLSVAAIGLKPFQDKNIEVAKKSDILKSVGIESDASTAVDLYEEYVRDSYVVNFSGEKVDGVAFDVNMKEELTKDVAARNLPVYVCQVNGGETKYILPVRGKGLWGPVWGYVAVNDDKNTIYGATFGHKGETPGLGAEIEKDDFQLQFKGKKILKEGKVTFLVAKGGAKPGDMHAVDAISGGTITSKGVEDMLVDCLDAYTAFLTK
jgi:Na+-transporting NADH:ubiquinone oxidoreductase subunit C